MAAQCVRVCFIRINIGPPDTDRQLCVLNVCITPHKCSSNIRLLLGLTASARRRI